MSYCMTYFFFTKSYASRFETSAKDNTNIEEAARHLISSILKLEEENADNVANDENTVNLNQQQQQQQQQNNGCC